MCVEVDLLRYTGIGAVALSIGVPEDSEALAGKRRGAILRTSLLLTPDLLPRRLRDEVERGSTRTRQARRAARQPLSLAAAVGEAQDGQLADLVEDVRATPPIDATTSTLLRKQVRSLRAWLSPRDSRILVLRFGLEDGRQRTLEQVGREVGVTRERIGQIEGKALRKPSRAKRLKAYWA